MADTTREPITGGSVAVRALAGGVSAAVALGVGELVSSLGGADHTLVTSVGTSFIDRFAGALKELAIALFGTNDKAALVVGIVVVVDRSVVVVGAPPPSSSEEPPDEQAASTSTRSSPTRRING